MRMDKRFRSHTLSQRGVLLVAILAGVFGAAFTVAQAYFLSRAIAQVFLQDKTLNDVMPLLGGLLVAAVLRAVCAYVSDLASTHLAVNIKLALREKLYAHILKLGPSFTRGERSGELVNTLTNGVEDLDAYLREYLPAMALATLIPILFLIVVFPMDVLTGVVLLLTGPLIPLFMVLVGIVAKQTSLRQFQSMSRMSAHFLDVLQGLTTLKAFNRSRAQIKIIGRVSDHFRGATMKVLRVAFLSALVLELVATISTAVVAVEIGVRLLYGNMAFEPALFVLILAPEFYMPLRNLGAKFHAGAAGVTAAQRILDVLDTQPEVTDSAGKPLPDNLQFALSFRDVQYAYDEAGRSALNGLTFDVNPGERVAIVGASGAGKSTVANLLLRFNGGYTGEISVDGHALDSLDADAWRENIAWVSQNPYLFDASVLDNIRLGNAAASDAAVHEAAKLAHAHEFIEALPCGYATRIGERGARLSGGQVQRIALARAFLKDAPLILLDEATANLDPEVEMHVQAAMARLFAGRTVIVVAHRLNTVVNADRIVVMDGGRVVESGTHDELLRQDGVYRQLVTAFGSKNPAEVVAWPA